MKIAVPTNDGLSISEHFGKSAAFLVFETENAQIASSEMRKNQGLQAHAAGSCGGDHSAAPHNHASIVHALAGCEVIICAGMGSRAAEALKLAGIREVAFTSPGPATKAVEAYLKGELPLSDKQFCRCSH